MTDDAGKYTCVASNAAGEAEQSIWLNVYGKSYTFHTHYAQSCTVHKVNIFLCEYSHNDAPLRKAHK